MSLLGLGQCLLLDLQGFSRHRGPSADRLKPVIVLRVSQELPPSGRPCLPAWLTQAHQPWDARVWNFPEVQLSDRAWQRLSSDLALLLAA